MRHTAKVLIYYFLGFALLLLSGCKAVVAENPLGTEVVKVDAKGWDGVWSSTKGKGIILIKVIDGNKGLINLGFISDERDGKFEVRNVSAQVRKGKDMQFLNIRVEDLAALNKREKKFSEEMKGAYVWFKLDMDDNTVVAVFPNEKFFTSLDNVKELKADNSLKLFGTSEELTEFVEDNSAKALSQDSLIKMIRKVPMD